LAAGSISCQTSSSSPAQGQVLQRAGKHGNADFKLELEPSPPAVGELFEVRTTVTDKQGKPVEGATFTLDATMPAHGHGMMTQPVHSDLGGGVYLSKGMKLHMAGRWVFEVEASSPAGKDSASIPFEQPATGN
jgi:nitrogen fixation protein FixH